MMRGEVRIVSCPGLDKKCPAVILTQDEFIPHVNAVTVAPITSSVRDVESQVLLSEDDGMKAPCAVNLQNVATIPKSLVGSWVTELGAERMRQICLAMNHALGCTNE